MTRIICQSSNLQLQLKQLIQKKLPPNTTTYTETSQARFGNLRLVPHRLATANHPPPPTPRHYVE